MLDDMAQLKDFQELGQYINNFSGDVEAPFDPEYLTDKPYEIPDLSSYEKRFYHKVSIVEKKLKSRHIQFEWLPNDELFRVKKFRYEERAVGGIRKKDGTPLKVERVYSEYPTYQYVGVYMETNEYCFGGWEEDLIVSSKISDVIDAVEEWLNNNEPALR